MKSISEITELEKMVYASIKENGIQYTIAAIIWELKNNGLQIFRSNDEVKYSESEAYKIFKENKKLTQKTIAVHKEKIKNFTKLPKIVFLIFASEYNEQKMRKTITSIQNQTYQNVEIKVVKENEKIDEMNKFEEQGMKPDFISVKECNEIKSDYLCKISQGDELIGDILFEIVENIQNNFPDIIYFDEEIFNKEIKTPFFKPDWSPELFLTLDYFSNCYFVKTDTFTSVGGFNPKITNLMNYDLILRLTDKTKSIKHIHKIGISSKQKVNFPDKQRISLVNQTLERRKIQAIAEKGKIVGSNKIIFESDKNIKVSIIIPTKNQKKLLKRCIKNIEKFTEQNYEIIIIDNNSTDKDTMNYLSSLPYKVIQYKGNFNFSKISNLAANEATGEFLLFLNDDAAPLKKNWLETMVSICRQKEIGVVGPQLVFLTNKIQHAGIAYLKTGAAFHPTACPSEMKRHFQFQYLMRNCSAVTGACLLVKKEIFRKCNGFDETLDVYYQDVDLCMKVMQLGHRIVYAPQVKLLHQGSSSIKKQSKAFFAVENHHYFVNKWKNIQDGDPYYNNNFGLDYQIKIDPNA